VPSIANNGFLRTGALRCWVIPRKGTLRKPPAIGPGNPLVTTVSPAVGPAELALGTPVTFHVTDATAPLSSLVLWMYFAALGRYELVYDQVDLGFVAPYAANSSVSTITNGYSFSIARSGGWPADPKLYVRASDGGLNP
jgi:hypothetical protein